ncbi:MAG: Transcriptional regulator, PadR family, partial [uncultured Blastococcus sp.]
ARVRHPRPAPPVPDARLRAAQAARSGARRAAQHLLRVPVPRAQADARGRAHLHRRAHAARAAAGRRPTPHGTARQGGLHDHRGRQGALPRAGQPDRPGRLRRRRILRRPPRLLRAHRLGRATADPRGPPAHGRAAAGGVAVLTGADPRTPRPLHPRAPAPRPGVGGPGGPLALGAHRGRTPGGRRRAARRRAARRNTAQHHL